MNENDRDAVGVDVAGGTMPVVERSVVDPERKAGVHFTEQMGGADPADVDEAIDVESLRVWSASMGVAGTLDQETLMDLCSDIELVGEQVESPGMAGRFERLSSIRRDAKDLEDGLRKNMEDYLFSLLGESSFYSWNLSMAKLKYESGKIVVIGIDMHQCDIQGVRINMLLERKGFRGTFSKEVVNDVPVRRLNCAFDLEAVERALRLKADLDSLEKDPVDGEE